MGRKDFASKDFHIGPIDLAEITLRMSNSITNQIHRLSVLNDQASNFTRLEDKTKITARYDAIIDAYNRYGLAVSTSMQQMIQEIKRNLPVNTAFLGIAAKKVYKQSDQKQSQGA